MKGPSGAAGRPSIRRVRPSAPGYDSPGGAIRLPDRPPPAGIEGGGVPQPAGSSTQRADPRDSHGNPGRKTGPERTGGRTATHPEHARDRSGRARRGAPGPPGSAPATGYGGGTAGHCAPRTRPRPGADGGTAGCAPYDRGRPGPPPRRPTGSRGRAPRPGRKRGRGAPGRVRADHYGTGRAASRGGTGVGPGVGGRRTRGGRMADAQRSGGGSAPPVARYRASPARPAGFAHTHNNLAIRNTAP